MTPSDLTSAPIPHVSSPVKSSSKKCSPLPAGSSSRLAGATTACVQTAPLSDTTETSSSRANVTAAAVGSCSITSPGSWTYDRLAYCLTGLQITYTEYNQAKPTEILGTGVLTVNSNATLSASSGQWQETETVSLTNTSGLVNNLSVSLKSGCSTGCTAISPNPWSGSRLLTKGQSASGNVTFAATPGAGLIGNITTNYVLTVVQPGTTPITADSPWTNPRPVRCDTTFASNTSTGCVIASVRPTLTLSLAQYGAAAALYGFAENYG
jgi:hypothetical protein